MVDHSIAVYIPQAAFDKYRFQGRVSQFHADLFKATIEWQI
jgi:hypothetical protein